VSETRAAPTAAAPPTVRAGAPTAAPPGRVPVVSADVATTEARPTVAVEPVAGRVIDAEPVPTEALVDPVAGPLRVIVGPVVDEGLPVELAAGTPTTGTAVRTVGSASVRMGVGVGVGVDVGTGVGVANDNGVLTGEDVRSGSVPWSDSAPPGEVSAESPPAGEVACRMTSVGDSSKVPAGVSDPPAGEVSVVASGLSGASVEAPTAPDFACVSVIDHSCSFAFPALRHVPQRRSLLCGFVVGRLVRVAGDRHEGHTVW
jgi:hypothetical protein